MSVMSLDNTLWLAYILTEVAVVSLLIYRRVWRLLPLFCVYCVWDVLSNTEGFASAHLFHNGFSNYLITYLIQTAIDSVLQFCVLVELAWSVLRPVRGSLPRYTLPAIGLLIFLIGVLIWPFAGLTGISQYPANVQLVVHLQQTGSILRILLFLAMAGCSQLLSIGWRDRELQVATGLGVYSLVSVGVTMMQAHQSTGSQYKHLNQFVVASFLCSLLYWIFSFAQAEAKRREFTPQMQNLLLAVAGVARAERTALTSTARPGNPQGKDR
jgi:hypothetical protein